MLVYDARIVAANGNVHSCLGVPAAWFRMAIIYINYVIYVVPVIAYFNKHVPLWALNIQNTNTNKYWILNLIKLNLYIYIQNLNPMNCYRMRLCSNGMVIRYPVSQSQHTSNHRLWLIGFKIHSETLTLSLGSEFAARPRADVIIITRFYEIQACYFTPGRRTRQCERT